MERERENSRNMDCTNDLKTFFSIKGSTHDVLNVEYLELPVVRALGKFSFKKKPKIPSQIFLSFSI